MLEFRLIEFSSFELSLSHESFSADPLCVVVGTFPGVLEVHESFDGYDPGPFLVAVPGAEVEHVLERPDLEARGDHILLFAKVTFVGLDFSEVNELRQFFEVAAGENQNVVHGQHHPAFSPLLQKLCSFIDGSLPDLVAPQLAFNYFWVHI